MQPTRLKLILRHKASESWSQQVQLHVELQVWHKYITHELSEMKPGNHISTVVAWGNKLPDGLDVELQ